MLYALRPSSCRISILVLQFRLPFLSADPFAEADEGTGETRQSQNYIHIRIQRMLLYLSVFGVARRSDHSVS